LAQNASKASVAQSGTASNIVCLISQQKCVQFLLSLSVLSNLWTVPILRDFPLQNCVFSELKIPEYRANYSASSLSDIYVRAVLLYLS